MNKHTKAISFLFVIITILGCFNLNKDQRKASKDISNFLDQLGVHLSRKYLKGFSEEDELEILYKILETKKVSGNKEVGLDSYTRVYESHIWEKDTFKIKNLEYYPTRVNIAGDLIIVFFNLGTPPKLEKGRKIKGIANNIDSCRIVVAGNWNNNQIYKIGLHYRLCDRSFVHLEKYFERGNTKEWTEFHNESFGEFLEQNSAFINSIKLTRSSSRASLQNLEDCELLRSKLEELDFSNSISSSF